MTYFKYDYIPWKEGKKNQLLYYIFNYIFKDAKVSLKNYVIGLGRIYYMLWPYSSTNMYGGFSLNYS
jgi:hypothetical protein